MKCTKCNRIIPDGSVFCNYCGSKIESISDIKFPRIRVVTIERARGFYGSAMVYHVLCDGKVVASLRNGEIKEFEIDDNAHTVQCRMSSPNMYFSSGNGGAFGGGGGTTESDVVFIPQGREPVELFVKAGFASLKLERII